MLDLNTNRSNRRNEPTEATGQLREAERPGRRRRLRHFRARRGADVRRLWAPNPRAGTVYPLGTRASELPAPRAGLLSLRAVMEPVEYAQ